MPKYTQLFLVFMLLSTVGSAQMSMAYENDFTSFNRGLELYEKQKYGAAKEQFEQSIEVIGDQNSEVSANAHFYIAQCALELFHKDAEFLLKQFIANYSSSPRVADAWFSLGNYNYRKKKWEEAIQYYDELQVINLVEPERSEYLFKKGYSYFQEDQKDEAAALFFQLNDPQSIYYAPGTYYLGHINYEQEKYAAALKSFSSLESHPQFGPVVPYYIVQIHHYQESFDEVITYGTPFLNSKDVKRKSEIARLVGEAHYHKQQYKEAVPFLREFMQSRLAKQKEDYYTYGYTLFRAGKYDLAAEQFSKISYADDELAQHALYQMGESYLKVGKKSYARNAYRSASQLSFDKSIEEDALFKYAQLSYELSYDPYDGAIAAFNEYIERYPKSDRTQEAYDYLVNIYLTSKNYDAALASIEAYENPDIRLREAYQRIAFNKGVQLVQDRAYGTAVTYFDKSLNFAQNKVVGAQALYWKAEALYYLGKYSESVKAYEAFIYSPAAALTPYFNLANYNIGYAYFQQDRFLEAPNWFRRYTSVRSEKDQVKLSDANLRIGDCYFMLNQYDAAQIYYSEAVKLGKSDPDYALYQKSMTAGLLKRPKDKLVGLEALVEKYPKSKYLDASYYEIARTQIQLGQDDAALSNLQKVVDEFPGSSYVRRALVGIGQTHYNAGRDDQALSYFQRIVKEFPNYEDSREALIGIKNIYLDKGKATEYESYIAGLDFVDFSETAKDSLYYESAEKQYFNGDCKESVDGFTRYLNRFDKALFALNARYYRADCKVRMGQVEEAIKDYQHVADQPRNKFTEPALIQLARYAYQNGDCAKALAHYNRIALIGDDKNNLFESEIGQMRCNYALNNFQGAIANAIIALEFEKADAKLKNEANLIIGRSNLKLKSPTEALIYLEKVVANGSPSQQAEALYLEAEYLFEIDQLDSAETLVFNVVENHRAQALWVAKSLVLLSDIYVTRGDLFQAKATLQAVLENYQGGGEVVANAQQKLDTIIEIENQPAEEEVEDIEIPFNGSDSSSVVQPTDTLKNE